MLKVYINPETVLLNDKPLAHNEQGAALLTELYRNYIGDYPKFFKMDTLSKLGFVASELLLQTEGGTRFEPREDRAIVFFNRSASLQADTAYQATIQDKESFFPSPAALSTPCPTLLRAKLLSVTSILARPLSLSCPNTPHRLWHNNCSSPSSTR